MGKILELIKSFINPIEPEKNFDELAVAAGVSSEDIATLKKSMGGLVWKFDGEDEEPRKTRKARVSPAQTRIDAEPKRMVNERKKGFDRED